MPENPILFPINSCNNKSLTFTTTDTEPVKWHKKPPILGLKYANLYVSNFPSLFNSSLRRTDILFQTRHFIDLGDHSPIKLPPRRYSPHQLEAIRDFCTAHEGKIIRKSKGPWAAPLLLTPKKTSSSNNTTVWRVCVDYRELNKITKKHAHPLPNAYDEIQRASGHEYYAFLDLKNGFWHIPMNPQDCKKTAFVTPFGIYEWLFMPFDLCNAPATFQSFMEEVLQPFRSFAAGLLDDMFSKDALIMAFYSTPKNAVSL